LISLKGRLTCEITDVFFAASMANAKAYLRVAGSAWHAWPGSDGTADGRPRDGLVSGAVRYCTGAYADELDNGLSITHTDADL
jgi:hypothetical protein